MTKLGGLYLCVDAKELHRFSFYLYAVSLYN